MYNVPSPQKKKHFIYENRDVDWSSVSFCTVVRHSDKEFELVSSILVSTTILLVMTRTAANQKSKISIRIHFLIENS